MKDFFTGKRSPFTYLNTTQFLGALNDNLFKLLIIYFLIDLQGKEMSNSILATAGAVFVLPFLLFSALSGTLADRLSKRNIIIWSKGLEVVVMVAGVTAVYFHSRVGCFASLFLMATQSALFGPSKYGIVPEIVESERISKANGLLTAFTYFAVIIGTFLASFMTDITDGNFIVVGTVCVSISLAGLFFSTHIDYTPPSGSQRKFSPLFLLEIYRSLRTAKKEHTLLIALFGSAFFLFAGAYVQLNIIPFAIQSLGLNETKGGYLFLVTSLGIGIGSNLAGRICGKHVELGLVPLAGLGMGICAFLLDYYSENLVAVIIIILITGVMAGMYVVPLDSFIQIASPDQHRGQVVAASNFLSFTGVLIASGMLYLVNELMGYGADKGFTICGIIITAWTLYLMVHLRDYFIRFIGMLVSLVGFELTIKGEKNVPPGKPALLVTSYRSWSDSLMVLGAQRQRMHLFFECKKGRSMWLKLLQRFFTIFATPQLDPSDLKDKTERRIRRALGKGQSVCIFLDERSDPAVEEFAQAYRSLLEDTDYPIVTVDIQKEERSVSEESGVRKLFHKFHVPATVTFR